MNVSSIVAAAQNTQLGSSWNIKNLIWSNSPDCISGDGAIGDMSPELLEI